MAGPGPVVQFIQSGAVDWVLLAVGPVALVAQRRHPVAALWVCLAATLPWSSGSGWAHVSFIVAFFVAATAGKRYWAWLALAIDFAGTIWLAPLIHDHAIPPLNDTLLLAGWTLALVIAAEATRFQAERAAVTRASRQIDQRRHQSEERLRVARDLHDVIGHNISLINVQASMGLDLMDSQPEQARAALSAIKSASKEALEELRTMLTTLRRDNDVAPRSSAPDSTASAGSSSSPGPPVSPSRSRSSERHRRCPPPCIWPRTASSRSR